MRRLPPRWRLVVREISRDRVRTLLAVLSMAVSVMSIGMVSGASVILTTTLDAAYRANGAAAAVLDTTPFEAGTLASVAGVAGVQRAEGRQVVHARVLKAAGDWRNLDLVAVPDYGAITLNRIFPEAGNWPPPNRAIVLERSSLSFLAAQIGGTAQVETPAGRAESLPVAGTAHDLNYPSAAASGLLRAYVTFSTLEWLGLGTGLTQIVLSTSGPHTTTAVEAVADRVRTALEGAGTRVVAVDVPQPGQFWADEQIGATVLLLDTLAVLAFLMSGFLVANIVSALVARQVRAIGVMKAIGATPRQVAVIYMGMVMAYGALALAVGVPAGAVGAVGIVESTRKVLNFDPPGFLFSPGVLFLQVLTALLVAVIAAGRPVLRAGRLSVREAISSEGAGAPQRRSAGRLAGGLPVPLRVSYRNAFRRRGRLALTLAALGLGGLAFVAVLSVRSSLDQTLHDAAAARGYDVQLRLGTVRPRSEIEDLAAGLPGVAGAETWSLGSVTILNPDRTPGPTVQLVGPPAGGRLLRPPLLAGRWPAAGEERALVVNSDAVHQDSALAVGGRVILRAGGKDAAWRVVGEARGLLGGAILYADRDQAEALLGNAGLADNVEVVGRDHSAAGQARLARAEESAFKAAGLPVESVDTTTVWRDFLAADYGIATDFLLAMAVLLALVGGLTLMGTMSINVIERTREIGVMRAVGASDGDLRLLVVGEGLVVAAAGWLLAAPLSPLAGLGLSDAFGQAFLHVPLVYRFSWPALGGWLGLVLVVGAVSSLIPARSAARLTVREVLAYS